FFRAENKNAGRITSSGIFYVLFLIGFYFMLRYFAFSFTGLHPMLMKITLSGLLNSYSYLLSPEN
ncbi:MAG: hypothetical protein ACXWDO_04240, partial [Bacteroidia bacterium]